MIIKKEERERHENSENCTIFGYLFNLKNLNVVEGEINGRYPDEGYVINTKVTELIVVKEGTGKVVLENRVLNVAEGDAVLVMPGKRFYYDNGSKLKVFIACSPAWYPEQYKEVK